MYKLSSNKTSQANRTYCPNGASVNTHPSLKHHYPRPNFIPTSHSSSCSWLAASVNESMKGPSGSNPVFAIGNTNPTSVRIHEDDQVRVMANRRPVLGVKCLRWAGKGNKCPFLHLAPCQSLPATCPLARAEGSHRAGSLLKLVRSLLMKLTNIYLNIYILLRLMFYFYI